MKEKLTKLYNTLAQIETKGENTKIMAACLNYTSQLIGECDQKVEKPAEGSEAT